MTRTDFQELAELRLKEAEALLAAGCWDGAYYLAGYAVECGLKACIAKLTRAETFPPVRSVVDACYSHDLVKLRSAARLEGAFQADAPAGSPLDRAWDVVKGWSEQSRYQRIDEVTARRLLAAVQDPNNNGSGVLPWIRRYW